ncbi:hypothetical protein FEM41_02295 [Jejubacter calystegiae]|uniref:Lipoprotein n=1 Tax=Jejubacter calystegiae TaxID=2579935 RepID=A0A4P8YDB0_9ENTR|nr:hypothetical protein [Jejubacter calystegiae]QCT18555.1 hypothetical protein FEM41_02295 [Jejubacter calystegiae]
MKRVIITSLFFLISACSPHKVHTSEQLLLEKVQTAIKTQNADPLSERDYDRISFYISEGKNHWIDLYPRLNKKPFLGMTSFQEGLNISMAYALSENPEETLKFIDGSNVGEICGVPFIEPTDDEIQAYYVKTRTALITHGTSRQWGKKCLSVLEDTVNPLHPSQD